MAVHVFQVSEENYQICLKRGLVAIPEPKDGARQYNNIFDGLLSRMACIKNNDYILMYVIGKKELRGVWQADGNPFYEATQVWMDRLYPFRCRIKVTDYNFSEFLNLYDINDLVNSEQIWTWALSRATGSNAMFSISDSEFNVLLNEYIKINPFSSSQSYIAEPYPYREGNIVDMIHVDKDMPKYEYSVMTLLNDAFCNKRFRELFGQYTDFLSYVPTNRGREMDIMLIYGNPKDVNRIMAYDIIEVKRDVFDGKALAQLIDYESWFLQKKVAGDLKMVRTTAIAKEFSDEVIDYVKKRSSFESKPIKLLTYSYSNEHGINLSLID